MPQIAIRCHHLSPVASDEIEEWLHKEVERLREGAPHAVFRLARLTQEAPNGEIPLGWMIEIQTAPGEPPLAEKELATTLRDTRLIGLQPTVLQAVENGAS